LGGSIEGEIFHPLEYETDEILHGVYTEQSECVQNDKAITKWRNGDKRQNSSSLTTFTCPE